VRGLAALALAAVLAPSRAEACAGCSNPNLPGAAAQGTRTAYGRLTASVSTLGTVTRVVHLSRCPELGPICRVRDEPPQYHDQRFFLAELRATLELGLTDRASVQLQLPLRLTRTTIALRREDGTPFEPDYENIHHRDETLFGPGDPWLSGRLFATLAGTDLAARAGLTLPLGRTEPDPFALGDAGLAHQHVQLGTGTVDPLLGLDAARRLGRVDLRGYSQARLTLYRNRAGYQAGHQLQAGLEGGLALEGGPRLALAVDVAHERPERWGGVVRQDGNLGRTDVLVGAGVRFALGETTVALDAKVPVYQRFLAAGGDPDEVGQLTYPLLLNLTLARSAQVF
jgi:hypothetical protein